MILPDVSSRRLVGRAAELDLLHQTRGSLAQSRGAVVMVGGEAGIGKSRLLAEFSASLSGGRAPHFAVGESLEHARRPYGPFRQVIESLLTAARPALHDAAPPMLRMLTAMAPDVLPPERQSPPSDKIDLFTGVLRLIERIASKRSVVIVLEDLHWADPATLELLAHIAPRIASMRVMIVGTYRDDEIHPAHPLFGPLARLARESNVRSMHVGTLDAAEVRAFITAALDGKYTVPAAQTHAIAERADGNPFFIEELLKEAIVRESTGGARMLPISLRATILERLDTLSAEDRRILGYAAVLGPRFEATTLQAIAASTEEDAYSALRRLRELNLVVEEAGERVRYRFRHALTRETIYDAALTAETRGLHERIAMMLESLPDAGARVDELAFHTWRAALREPAMRYNERAGDAAFDVHASADAATYFARARKMADNDADRMRLLDKSGESARRLADFGGALEAFDDECRLALQLGDFDVAARAMTKLCGELSNTTRREEAIARFDRFVNAYGDRLSTPVYDYAMIANARVASSGDDYARARRLLAAVREPANLDTVPHALFHLTRSNMAEDAVDRAAWDEAVAAMRLRLPQVYPLLRTQIVHTIAASALTFGDAALADRAIDEAIAIDLEHGLMRVSAFAYAVKARVDFALGRLAEARQHLEIALAETGMPVALVHAAACAPLVALALDDHALGRRLLDHADIAQVDAITLREERAHMDAAHAAWLAAAGKVAEARTLLGALLQRLTKPPSSPDFYVIAARYVEGPAVAPLRALCARARENPDHRLTHAAADLADAVLAARGNGPGSAHEHGMRAASRFAQLGWPLLQAQSLEVAGAVDAARAMYERCGSIGDVRRLSLHAPQAVHATVTSLSPRERDVAALIGRGLTNRAIGQALSVSEKRIERHVTSIYAKLGFSTRAQLAAYVARDLGRRAAPEG